MNQNQRYTQLGTMPINKLIPKMATPTILAMLATAIYNLTDTFFVSRLGTSQSAAVGIVFPLMSIIQALGMTFGAGGASYISRLLGEKRQDEASRTVATSFFSAIVTSVIFAGLCYLFVPDLMRLFGATETILPYAVDYTKWILLGTPFIAVTFVLNQTLRAEGNAVLAMAGIMVGGSLNMILDPIFINVLDMGIAGAAIATIISQFVGFCILLAQYVMRKSNLTLSSRQITISGTMYGEIFKIGVPTFLRQSLSSVFTILLNNFANPYGDSTVAATSVVMRINFMIFAILLGFAQGYQPVAGFNYGARNGERLKQAFQYSIKVILIVMSVACVFFLIFAPQVMNLFLKHDPEAVRIGSQLLRYLSVPLPILGVAVIVNFTYQAFGSGIPSTILSTCRQGWAGIPVLFVTASFFGLTGVIIAMPIADVIFGLTGIAMGFRAMHQINTFSAQEKQEDILIEKERPTVS